MRLDQTEIGCQIPSLPRVGCGLGEVPPQSFGRLFKLAIRRRLSPDSERAFKRWSNDLINAFCRLTGRPTRPYLKPVVSHGAHIQAGDAVRIRDRTDIEATLNQWRQLRGCTFMPEMAEYCGTTQRVLNRVERFVDERDLVVKTAKGLVLLEGLRCRGTAEFGRCDRACTYFWREEWLENENGSGTLALETRAELDSGQKRSTRDVLRIMLGTSSLDCG